MPHILAIDTSTDACSVAVLTPENIWQRLSVSPREHTQRLLPAIESLLAEQQLCLAQFDAIAFGIGPGSFTGLRISASIAQGLAYGADLPVIPISTLHTLAQTAVRLNIAGPSQTIVPVIDARMDEVYWSAYTGGDGLLLEPLCEEQIASPLQLSTQAVLTSEVIGVGSGWNYDCLHSANIGGYEIECYPQAYDVAVLAKAAYMNNKAVCPSTVVPAYMRNEISWKKRQRIRA